MTPGPDHVGAAARVAAECPLSPWTGQPGACRWCCAPVSGARTAWCSDRCRRAFEVEHLWSRARARARRAADRRCQLPGCPSPAGGPVEVDHLEPALGQHGRLPSCVHHRSNLRVLCVACHRTRTALQAVERAAARRAP